MSEVLTFGLLAGVATLCRFEVSIRLNRPGRFPTGTLLANLTATAAAAFVLRWEPELAALVVGGALGALSTFSTVAAELVELWSTRRPVALAYLVATLGGATALVVLLGPA